MQRAIQLARNGSGFTSPNPMVGAVIVVGDRIIGEGWHRRCGGPHAEVNAVAMAKAVDPGALKDSTIYVTLEPCSHYGKTPPCAKLLTENRIPRVVVGSVDPNDKVSGRGIQMLRESGVEVAVGVLEEECRSLNPAFMTAHSLHRPYVLLKWACSADGFLDCDRAAGEAAPRFSNSLSMMAMHRLRRQFDAIMVGSNTAINDDPRLDVRLWPGRSPRRVVVDRRGRIRTGLKLLSGAETWIYGLENKTIEGAKSIEVGPESDVATILDDLYQRGITSVMVEGGATLLRSFIAEGLWDVARVEISPVVLGAAGRCPMTIPTGRTTVETIGENRILSINHQ
ncbi:MAG: bifunctional diaminohydroxyphosphoribosylaminopyrimidine deaminase/5-amino-6-(5-phosphoribosylamino)uracil reductase RibD [Bacteroides sp.]|nr:bifunctional diaminohydroxyphosphoribosylaminopyrimidine deaminase/5-amino-6-(5-phosphoribosylamino)uracil reductase RibD [Bacteroides sp.]MCM1471004.1 bifunctional diaminohydroxyphosphoribosylaminopyrimidine deaminase/5-amino-6-(5-phosphoribosylamino)uracil reductase RibD [Bacteroides sp.]